METPVYLFYVDKVADSYREMQRRLPLCDVYYALKANSELKILSILKEIDAKFDAASTEEFMKLMSLGISPERVICSLPVKSDEMIKKLYTKGCRYFVFDHILELHKLIDYSYTAKKILRIYTSDIINGNIEYGMTEDEFFALIRTDQNLIHEIDGLTFHINDNRNIENLINVLNRCENFIRELDPNKKLILNIGGNYQVNKIMNDEYYFKLNQCLARLQSKYSLTLLSEPGNGIINEAGILLTKVVMIKERKEYFDVYIDAGEPIGVLKKPYGIYKFDGAAGKSDKKYIYRFIGITCTHMPLFIFPLKYKIQKDDILALEGYGSYSICYNNNFHSWKLNDTIYK